MNYFRSKSEATSFAKLLTKAGYEVGPIEGKKASGYGVYRTQKGFWFDSNAPGDALEVAAAFLRLGRYEHKAPDVAEMDWLSRQYPLAFEKISSVAQRNPGMGLGQIVKRYRLD